MGSVTLGTPLHQVGVTRAFTELVFRLDNVVAPLLKQSFEYPPDVFVKQNLRSRHWTVSFGFS